MNVFPVKPRECEICAKSFIPFKSTQKVCGLKCAQKVGRQLRAKEKVELKARKAALKTIPDLIKEAQKEFNAWVRKRDEEKPCICCGRPTDRAIPGVRSHNIDAGHFRSVGSAPHLRFHEDNCHAQLVLCNRWGAGRAVDYRIGLVQRIGLARVEALESDYTVKKWEREELIAIRDAYKAKRKELEKARE